MEYETHYDETMADVLVCSCEYMPGDEQLFATCSVCIASATNSVEVEMEEEVVGALDSDHNNPCSRCGSVAKIGPNGLERTSGCEMCISACRDRAEYEVIFEEEEKIEERDTDHDEENIENDEDYLSEYSYDFDEEVEEEEEEDDDDDDDYDDDDDDDDEDNGDDDGFYNVLASYIEERVRASEE